MELLKLNSNQKDKVRLGLVLVAALVLLILAFFAGRSYQKRIPSESEKYLQEQVDKYKLEAETWRNKATTISVEVESLKQTVVTLETKIKVIRDQYDKKVIIVKSYSNPELEQFFADRYSD